MDAVVTHEIVSLLALGCTPPKFSKKKYFVVVMVVAVVVVVLNVVVLSWWMSSSYFIHIRYIDRWHFEMELWFAILDCGIVMTISRLSYANH